MPPELLSELAKKLGITEDEAKEKDTDKSSKKKTSSKSKPKKGKKKKKKAKSDKTLEPVSKPVLDHSLPY